MTTINFSFDWYWLPLTLIVIGLIAARFASGSRGGSGYIDPGPIIWVLVFGVFALLAIGISVGKLLFG